MLNSHISNQRILQRHFGEPRDALVSEEIPLERLAAGKVRVRIEATNINPSDLLSIRGVGQYKHSHQPPRVPGFEAVGWVVESNSETYSQGQRVVVAAGGTWQTFVDVEIDNLFVIPESLPMDQACQLYINGLTAWVLTRLIVKVRENDIVIINAGSSAIGKIFAQLSRAMKFKLIAVTSRPKEYCYDTYGVLDASCPLLPQLQHLNLDAPSLALDAIGGEAGIELMQTMRSGAQFINYGTLSMTFYPPEFFTLAKSQSVHFDTFFLRYWEEKVGKAIRREQFMKMLQFFLFHEVKFDLEQSFSLTEVKEAIHIIECNQRRLTGKLILHPN